MLVLAGVNPGRPRSEQLPTSSAGAGEPVPLSLVSRSKMPPSVVSDVPSLQASMVLAHASVVSAPPYANVCTLTLSAPVSLAAKPSQKEDAEPPPLPPAEPPPLPPAEPPALPPAEPPPGPPVLGVSSLTQAPVVSRSPAMHKERSWECGRERDMGGSPRGIDGAARVGRGHLRNRSPARKRRGDDGSLIRGRGGV